MFQPLSTGITFALTEKAPGDKIPLITAGYGRSESTDGNVFKWNFPLTGTYWDAADILIQHVGKKEGGLDKLKGKKIALVYHDSPYGKEPIPLLRGAQPSSSASTLQLLPVTHPGVEQKATWLQIRQNRPDYVFLWGWGVMNSTALKEAVATGYPRDKMYGVWWAAAEPDVKDVGEGAKGYSGLALQHGAEPNSKVVKDVLDTVHAKGQGTGSEGRSRAGAVHARPDRRDAGSGRRQARAGTLWQGQGRDRRAGTLGLREPGARPEEARRAGLCRRDAADQHLLRRPPRGRRSRACTPGTASSGPSRSDWIEADQSIIKPMIKAAADKYAAEKKITRRTAEDCQS